SYYANITNSAIAKYMNAKTVLATDADQANAVGAALDQVFRCPSDNLDMRPLLSTAGGAPYRYSYSMNDCVTYPVQSDWNGNTDASGVAHKVTNNTVPRNGFTFNGKMTSVKKPSDIILYVCEDEKSVDDSIFKANPSNWASGGSVNAVAARH